MLRILFAFLRALTISGVRGRRPGRSMARRAGYRAVRKIFR